MGDFENDVSISLGLLYTILIETFLKGFVWYVVWALTIYFQHNLQGIEHQRLKNKITTPQIVGSSIVPALTSPPKMSQSVWSKSLNTSPLLLAIPLATKSSILKICRYHWNTHHNMFGRVSEQLCNLAKSLVSTTSAVSSSRQVCVASVQFLTRIHKNEICL